MGWGKHLPYGVKEGFPEEAAPGLCASVLDWKDCPLLGRDFASRKIRKARGAAQGKESRE